MFVLDDTGSYPAPWTLFIEPGSLWGNGYVESFKGKLSDEPPDGEVFDTHLEANVLIERYRVRYNTVQPTAASDVIDENSTNKHTYSDNVEVRLNQLCSEHVEMRFNMMAFLFAVVAIAGCDDDFHGASRSIEKSVATSSQPTIIVDASCGGAITIKPGKNGEVKAIIDRNSNCKNLSQSVAEESLRFIDIEMLVEGDVVRVVTSRTDDGASKCSLTTSIELHVPDKARLDLKTDVGSIYVVGSPLEVKAVNRIGAMAFVLTPPSDTSIAPRRTAPLKLEGWGGDVGIKLGQSDYEFTGPIKLVERLTSESND